MPHKSYYFPIVFLLLVVPYADLRAQSEGASSSRWAMGLIASADYCYRKLLPEKNNKDALTVAEIRDTIEIPKLGYTVGYHVAFRINKRFSLELGLQYADRGERSKKYPAIYPTSQPDPLIDAVKFRMVSRYKYFDIPLKAKFYILNNKLKLFVSAGFSPSIFLSQRDVLFSENAQGKVTKIQSIGANHGGYVRVNPVMIAGLGVQYDLFDKLYIKAEPTYRRSIASIIDAPIKSYLYSTGLELGVFYRL